MSPYVPLAERASRAAQYPRTAAAIEPDEVVRRFAIDRLGDVLGLDMYDREWIFAELDPVSYAGTTVPSVRLYFDEAATLDSTGEEPELHVLTGPDGAQFFHLLAPCPGCTRPVPVFEFATLAELGLAQAAQRGDELGASARLSHLFAVRDHHAKNCRALATALALGSAR